MIWYIIMATAFFFQTGYVTCTESIVSMTGGVYTNLSSAKFMASIYVQKIRTNRPPETKFQCAGVIVHKDYILTSAAYANKSSSDLKVHVGTETIGVDSIKIMEHKSVSYRSLALLKLNNSLTLSNESGSYERITLPVADFIAISGMDITVLGYGILEPRKDRVLSTVTIKALDSYDFLKYSFCAKDDNSRLSYEDRGCPAFYQGIFVGMVVLTSNNGFCPVELINIFRVKQFIVGNMTV